MIVSNFIWLADSMMRVMSYLKYALFTLAIKCDRG